MGTSLYTCITWGVMIPSSGNKSTHSITVQVDRNEKILGSNYMTQPTSFNPLVLHQCANLWAIKPHPRPAPHMYSIYFFPMM